jgi:transcriptional regulator with XRE-family HTH domain
MAANFYGYKSQKYTGKLTTMLASTEQRRLLGGFLRARREALTPGVGAGRRRTPGLRREEVAVLCGMSATWYTWVEQGREIALSATALARLAGALRLTAAERAYMFELARKRDPAPFAPPPAAAVPPELASVLDAYAAPAYLLDRLWHAKAWNAPAARLFAPWLNGPEPCLLRFVFLDPAAKNFIFDWQDRAQRLLAEFRADMAPHQEDPQIQDLIERLREESPDFARLWTTHTVLAREGGERLFNHPETGLLRFEQVTLTPATHRDHKLVILLAA